MQYGKIIVSLFCAFIVSYFVIQIFFPFYTPKLDPKSISETISDIRIPEILIPILDLFQPQLSNDATGVNRRGKIWFSFAPTSVPAPTAIPVPTRMPTDIPYEPVIFPTDPVIYKSIPTPTIVFIPPTSAPYLTRVQPTATPWVPTSPPLPTIAPTSVPLCWDMEQRIPPSEITEPGRYSGTPKTSLQIVAYDGTPYSVPYRNPECTVTESLIQKAYSRMQSFYPSYFSKTRLLNEWKIVQEKAKRYNFNPIFVISLWIEESAAGGATQATQLGCDYRFNKDGTASRMSPSASICDEMLCMFNLRPAHPQNFVSFACQYQFGSMYYDRNTQTCQDSPNFAKTLSFWYEMLSEGQPYSCKMKFCPNAPGC